MTSLQAIQEQRAQWAQDRPSGPTNNLWFRKGDIAFLHFIGTGNDPDPYMEVYLAHELPASEPGGYPKLMYCPVTSGHDPDYSCPYCDGEYKLKERMQMWFWVGGMLHEVPRQGETLPTTVWAGKTYFQRELNRPMIWDASAWRESPLDEIIFIHGQTGNLRSRQMIMRAVNDGMERRYRISTMDNSAAFDESLIANYREILKPVRQLLLEGIQQAPTQARSAAPVPGAPLPGASMFNPAAAAAASPFQPQNFAAPAPFVPGAADSPEAMDARKAY